MTYSIGDGLAVIGVAAGVVGYCFVKYLGRTKRLEIVHQERMVAMEKGIPLPEFPLEPVQVRFQVRRDGDRVIPLLGIVLLSLSLGTMILLGLNFAGMPQRAWVAPLPFAFLGAGFLAYHLLQGKSGR
jgi:hypothetical protein